MPTFVYTGRAANGEATEGRVEAASLPAALARLREEGPGRVEQIRVERKRRAPLVTLSENDLALLYQQLADAITSGLPLTDAVGILSRESPDRRIRALMHRVLGDLRAGHTLTAALDRFPEVFPALHRSVVAAGEDANALDTALRQLAAHTETTTRAAGSLAAALAYPAVVSVVGLGVITFLLTAVVPKFEMMFRDLGVREQPLITRLILGMQRLYLPVLAWLVVGAVLAYLIGAYLAARQGGITVDRWKLRIPVLGPFLFHMAQGRVAGTLAILVENGVPLPEAVRTASRASGNRVLESALQRTAALVEEGCPLSEALASTGAAPEVLTSRAAVGEGSGRLPEALRQAAEYHTSRARATAAGIGPMLEPTFIIILALCVGLIVVGMLMPLLVVIQSLSGG